MPNPLQRLFIWAARLWNADDPRADPEPLPTDAAATLEAAQQATTAGDYTRAATLYQRAHRIDPSALTVDGRPHDAVTLADRHALYVKIKRLSTAKHPVTLQTAWDDWCDFRQRFGTHYDPDNLAPVMAATAQTHGFKDKHLSAYSHRAQDALRTARAAALTTGKVVQPQHLLLGILLTADKADAEVLQVAGLDAGTVAAALGIDHHSLAEATPTERTFADVDPAFVGMLGAARTIADDQGTSTVGTHHLLLALWMTEDPGIARLLVQADDIRDIKLSNT